MTFLPYRRSTMALLGLLLIDVPVLAGVAVVGMFYGFSHTFWTVAEWRQQHPVTLLPSAAFAVALFVRRRRSRLNRSANPDPKADREVLR